MGSKPWRLAVGVVVLVLALEAVLYMTGLLDGIVTQRARTAAFLDLDKRHGNRWFDISTWQFPDDLMVYQEILFETRPDVIVETGTAYGGFTIWMAMLMEWINPDVKIITVDLNKSMIEESLKKLDAKGKERIVSRIVSIEGSSNDVADAVAKLIPKDAKVLVILDSDHAREYVRKELDLYAPLATPGSYVIVNDTYYERGLPGFGHDGGLKAVRDFVAANPNFEIDRSREKFTLTCAPGGFVKRVR